MIKNSPFYVFKYSQWNSFPSSTELFWKPLLYARAIRIQSLKRKVKPLWPTGKQPVGDASQEWKSLGLWRWPCMHGSQYLMGWSVLLTLIWPWIRISRLNFTSRWGWWLRASITVWLLYRVSPTSRLGYRGGKSFNFLLLPLYHGGKSFNFLLLPLYHKSSTTPP
jgi:hypothetical protein